MILIAIVAAFPSFAWAQNNPRFLTSQEEIDDLKVLQLRKRLSMGLQLYSVVPNSRPFQAVDGNQVQDFRYQISGALGLELFYKLRPRLDIGLAAAFEAYESRLEQGSASTEFSRARMRLFPVMGLARWSWRQGSWTPEAEAGLGMGIFNMLVDSTNLAQNEIKDSAMSLLAHGSLGVSVAWLEDTNIGLSLGYRAMLMGVQDFSGDLFNVRRKSLSGLFAKASLRYAF